MALPFIGLPQATWGPGNLREGKKKNEKKMRDSYPSANQNHSFCASNLDTYAKILEKEIGHKMMTCPKSEDW